MDTGDGSVLVVSIPAPLPELARVAAAIAAEKWVTVFDLNDARGSVWPREAVCGIG
jgi:hypothetical protein